MLAGSFPLLAAAFFGAIAVAFAMLDASGAGVKVAPGLAVAACLALALGYAGADVEDAATPAARLDGPARPRSP